MTTSAAPPTTTAQLTMAMWWWRWPDDDATDDGETSCDAVARDGRSLPAAVGKPGGGGADLRRTSGAIGGSTRHLAREQSHGAAAEDVQTGLGALHRGRQLPARTATGRGAVPSLAELAVGGPAPFGSAHRTDRHRQELVGPSAGQQGLPGR